MAPSEKAPKSGEYQEAKLWFERKGSTITIGITSRAVEDIGDIQSIDFPDEGEDFSKGDVMLTVEGISGEIEVTAPASGVVEGINEDVKDSPELILEDPLEGGWIIKLEAQDVSDLIEFSDEDMETSGFGEEEDDDSDDEDEDDEEEDEDDFDEDDLEEGWEDEEVETPARSSGGGSASRAATLDEDEDQDEDQDDEDEEDSEDFDDEEEDEDFEESEDDDEDEDESPRGRAPAKKAAKKPAAKKSKVASKAKPKKGGKK